VDRHHRRPGGCSLRRGDPAETLLTVRWPPIWHSSMPGLPRDRRGLPADDGRHRFHLGPSHSACHQRRQPVHALFGTPEQTVSASHSTRIGSVPASDLGTTGRTWTGRSPSKARVEGSPRDRDFGTPGSGWRCHWRAEPFGWATSKEGAAVAVDIETAPFHRRMDSTLRAPLSAVE